MESNNKGWICLHRSILNWEWWSDQNTFRLFIYCLLMANHEDRKWQGKVIERGSFITTLANIKQQTKLSLQQVRTSLAKLQETGEINIKTTNQNTHITICNYAFYQDKKDNEQQTGNKQITNEQQTDNKQITNEQQTDNKQITNEQQTDNKHNNNYNNNNNINNNNNGNNITRARTHEEAAAPEKENENSKENLRVILLETFKENFFKKMGTEYMPQWATQTEDSMAVRDFILAKMREPQNNITPTPGNFRAFTERLLDAMYNAADDFLKNKWGLHLLNKEFNQLYIRIINKKNNGNTTDKTDYMQRIVDSMQE